MQKHTNAPSREAIFNRATLLLGSTCMERINRARVIIFGLGGVGSWCAESLARTGIHDLTLVDSDRVCVTNINRQIQATCATIGQVKTEALRSRLLEINPAAQIHSIQKIYEQETETEFDLDAYDFVIDAIDSLNCKMRLLYNASRSHATVFSAFGAACKLDPTRVRTDEFRQVKGCPLGSKLRKLMRRANMLPEKEVVVVYSDEVLANAGQASACGSAACLCPRTTGGPGDPALLNHEWCSQKAVINGSLAHITGIFGLTLAGLVIQRICLGGNAMGSS
jgi:tRNA A37 threonylcarbamoyladenosine dehydratase